MNARPAKPAREARLDEEALGRIAASLADQYAVLYDERANDPRVSLTGNMLAFVFEGGLSVSDEWLLRHGSEERLREFREQFFEVVAGELVGIVAELSARPVTYSFNGFDPRTRTTHVIFVLDLRGRDTAEERQALLNWSEQVRRNARRLREEHTSTREMHHELLEKVKAQREQFRREAVRAQGKQPPGDGGAPRSDDA
jgi:hypothetical protein